MSGAFSRDKGARGEREIVGLLRAHGWTTSHRNFQSGGQGNGDIAYSIPGVLLEVKREEKAKVWEWWEDATAKAGPGVIPVVPFRRNRSPWLAMLEFDELCALLLFRERA
jgi:hypothetical protein